MSFERSVLEDLARSFPEKAEALHGLVARMEDLIVPFRAFHLYHPAQQGSCSIKKVLPAFTDLSYEGMGIQEGDVASMEYLRVVFGEDAPEDHDKLRANLREYCELDTLAMVKLLGVAQANAGE